jgi:hypothetical protein
VGRNGRRIGRSRWDNGDKSGDNASTCYAMLASVGRNGRNALDTRYMQECCIKFKITNGWQIKFITTLYSY